MSDSKSTNKIAVQTIKVDNTQPQDAHTGVQIHTPNQTPVPTASTYQQVDAQPSTDAKPITQLISKDTPTISQTQKQNKISPKMPFQWSFLLPQYWGIWLLIGVFMLLIRLPLRYQFWLGKKLGIGMYHIAKTRRNDTLVNLRLAFAEKLEAERELMAKQVFVNQGIGLFETLCAWYHPDVFTRTVSISGLQHVINAQNQGRGVLLLGAHYTMLDLGARLMTQFFAADGMYRPQNNKLLDWVIYNARRRWASELIGYRDMRHLVSRLKQGNIVWYSADQDFGLKYGVMARFFGVPAATITTPRYLATIQNKQGMPSVLIGLHTYRQTPDNLPKGKRPHYHITLTPPLQNYPSDDEVADATRVNEMYEGLIRIDPTQWMWFHRRYKRNENGRTDYYR